MSEGAQQDAAHAPLDAVGVIAAGQVRPAKRTGRPISRGFRPPDRSPLSALTNRQRIARVRSVVECAVMGDLVPAWQVSAALRLLDHETEVRDLRAKVRELEAQGRAGGASIQIVFAGGFGGQAPAIDGESVALPRGLDVHKP